MGRGSAGALLLITGCISVPPATVETDSDTSATVGTTVGATTATSATSATSGSEATGTSTAGTTSSGPSTGSTDGTSEGSSTGCESACEPGAFLWQNVELGRTFVPDMHAMPDGSVYLCLTSRDALTIAGVPIGGDGDPNVAIVRMLEDGSFDWAVGHGGPEIEFCISLSVNAEDEIALAGFYTGVGEYDGQPLPDAGADFASYFAIIDTADKSTLHLETAVIPNPGSSTSAQSGPVAMNAGDDLMFAVSHAATLEYAGGQVPVTEGVDLLYGRFDGMNASQLETADVGDEWARGVVLGAGGAYLTGDFSGEVTFGGDVRTAFAGYDAFIVRGSESMDSISWIVTTTAAGDERPTWSDSDGAGNLYVAGEFTVEMGFSEAETEAAVEQEDIWLAKIDPTGDVVWLRTFGGLGEDRPRSVAVTDAGDVAMSGEFANAIDLGDGVHTTHGDIDAFVAKFDADGELVWSNAGGGAGIDRGLGVEFAPDGSVYVAFSYFDDADFGGGVLPTDDIGCVIVKYAP